jgi:hypothetical protein
MLTLFGYLLEDATDAAPVADEMQTAAPDDHRDAYTGHDDDGYEWDA